MDGKDEKMLCHRWAELRFSVVGGLLSCPPGPGRLQGAIRELARKEWIHPKSGEPVRFGFSTIEAWYYRARGSDNPIGALSTLIRADSGKNKTMNAALTAALRRQYELHPGWSYDLHHKNLAVVAGSDPSKYGKMPSYSTLRRRMKSFGWTKKKRPRNPTPGRVLAVERLEKREVRSFEATHAGALGHLDFHKGSLDVVDKGGEWHFPECFAELDDYSRVCLHAQWYLVENTENLVHGFEQATMKRGLLRSLMSDRGSAMMSEEFQNGLRDLSIVHKPTLAYSPYQNAKQENFWATLEGQLMAMLENVEELTLDQLNVYTQAWVEMGYNRHFHEEIGCTPLERFLKGPEVFRPSPDTKALRLAFSARVTRKQRKSDGTVSLGGVRFEIPGHLRTLDRVTIRYRSWNLSSASLVDPRTHAELAKIHPVDKHKNADGFRKTFGEAGIASYPEKIEDSERVAPLLEKMLEDYAATGLPPAYIPKDEIILGERTDEKGER
jgi:transposase InsO family protein